MFWIHFEMVTFPFPLPEKGEDFSESLVGLLKVRFMKAQSLCMPSNTGPWEFLTLKLVHTKSPATYLLQFNCSYQSWWYVLGQGKGDSAPRLLLLVNCDSWNPFSLHFKVRQFTWRRQFSCIQEELLIINLLSLFSYCEDKSVNFQALYMMAC